MFTGADDDVTIRVWGANNVNADTPSSALDAYCAKHDVSYKSLGENSFVTTWEENGTIVYVRELVSDSVVHAVWIECPSSTSDRGNAIVEQVVPTRKTLG